MRINSYRDISKTFHLKIEKGVTKVSSKNTKHGFDVTENLTTLRVQGYKVRSSRGFQVIKQVSL